MDDTPTHQEANYGCPSYPSISCNNGPNGDMSMNYMDYTNDACVYVYEWTKKQNGFGFIK